MGTSGAEAESMTEDIVPDARAGASVEKSVEALAVVCSAAGVKLGLSEAMGYDIGRKPRTDSARLICWLWRGMARSRLEVSGELLGAKAFQTKSPAIPRVLG